MSVQPELKGSPNGTLSDEAIRKHAAYLSSETVNVTHGGFMSRAPILLEYWSDGDQFSFRFSPPALRFLEEADDPRLDLVADLFSGIDPQAGVFQGSCRVNHPTMRLASRAVVLDQGSAARYQSAPSCECVLTIAPDSCFERAHRVRGAGQGFACPDLDDALLA